MTDYLLTNGTNRAAAAQAPAHMAEWLEAKGYRLVRSARPFDPQDPALLTLIGKLVEWPSCEDEDGRRSIVSQVLSAISAVDAATPDIRRAA
jgi:hypothetical protein